MRLQDVVLTALEHELLDPAILEAAIARAVAHVAARMAGTPESLEVRRHTRETALAHAETALARLTQAVAARW